MGFSELQDLHLPPIGIEDDPAFQSNSFHRESCSYVVSGPIASLKHTTFIVSLVAELLSNLDTNEDLDFTLHNHLAWMLDSLATIRNLARRWPPDLAYQETRPYLISSCFASARHIVSWLRDQDVSVLGCKSYMLLVDICADMVEVPAVLAIQGLPEIFCTTLGGLVSACRMYEPVADAIGIRLVPALEVAVVEGVSPLITTSNLQV